jgi:hypothetical protein
VQIATLVYIAVLWLGVLPTALFPGVAWMSSARNHSRTLFAAVRLHPGHVIFTGSPTEWKIASNCLRVVGETPDGRRLTVYANECPGRAGFRIYNPPFDQVMQEMTRVMIRPPLIATSPGAAPLRDISEYFCHSPLETHPRSAAFISARPSMCAARRPASGCEIPSCAV